VFNLEEFMSKEFLRPRENNSNDSIRWKLWGGEFI